MATKKKAELEFKAMCNLFNIWAHKWPDLRFCPNCRKPIYTVKEETPGEVIVDFLIYFGNISAWVECKGAPGHTTMPFVEVTEKQKAFMTSWIDKDVLAFLFLTLGSGHPPKERFAWLVPWAEYLNAENYYKAHKRLSLPITSVRVPGNYTIPGINTIFADWALLWIPRTGWSFTEGSKMQSIIPDLFTLQPLGR